MSEVIHIDLKITELEEGSFHLFCDVEINGIPANALIDTGASRSVIGKEFIEQDLQDVSIEDAEHQIAGVGSSSMAGFLARIDHIQLGELLLADESFAVIDLSHINTAYDQLGFQLVDLVIGCDLLIRFNALIDLQARKMSLIR